MPQHEFSARVKWTGNTGTGTSSYKAYSRAHEISAAVKAMIPGSSAPEFLGDASRYNPEELLIASLSACHMLWALHLCSEAGVIVTGYEDDAVGEMEIKGGNGRFTSVTLHPKMVIRTEAAPEVLSAIHERAHKLCFIANSVNFPVQCVPEVSIEEA